MTRRNSEDKKRYIMHVSSVDGHQHMVSRLTNDSASDILTNLFGEEGDVVIAGDTAQGEDFYVRIEPLADYVDSLPEGRDKEFFTCELAKPGWSDSKIGNVIFKMLLLTRMIRID